MKLITALSLVLAAILFGRDASAGGLVPLVRVGDTLSGLGPVTALASRVAVDDSGSWWVLASSGTQSAIVSNGQIVLRTGDPLSSPSGATVAAIRSFGVSRGGTAVWTVDLSTGGSGIYRGSDLAMQTGTPVLPGGTFPSGSTYSTFRHAQPNGTNRFLLLGTANTVSAGPTDFVSVVNCPTGLGPATSESVRVRTNTPIAITQIIDSVPVRPEQAAIDGPGGTTFTFLAAGQSWVAQTSSGCSTGSACTLLLDSQGTGPTGEPLGDLWGAGVGMNSFGRWVSKVKAGTTNTVRICGNFGSSSSTIQLYAAGSTFPGIAPYAVESIVFDGPIFVTDNNAVVWYANWTDPVTTRDEGILVSNAVVVREGVTALAGGTIDALDPYGFAVSENGRYLVFRGRQGSVEGAFRLDLNPSTAYCFGDGTGTPCPCGGVGLLGFGCPHSALTSGARLGMRIGGTTCVSADTVTLEVTFAPAATSSLFFQGTNRLSGGAGLVFGDGLRCVGGSIIRLATKTTSGGTATYPGSSDTAVSVRGLVPAGGGTRTYQVWYRNAASFCTVSTFNLTNGLEIVWEP